ncbi:HD domain-containing protein [Entomomonas asaccharolytica]|uniref:N-methyl-D-aspartate receptor NMDAR2C subunit n=1 Tax=Entomomonas asaccharolytica TaxID=2785331 RepID=A0A974NHH8_9GAMM|nr:N-methyl-D-aspartate receptor NMDAR2C subunit [Entomomonas asaccharolytica]QQP86695.1 N-methyl-D-aspartate receptor NMDAR2C subunit [Entomomonas asaccharolytica]
MNLQTRWLNSCQQLGVSPDQTIFIKLVNYYSQPDRHYHTLQYLQECFCYFDLVKDQAEMSPIIEMALWFHDAIYNVRGHNNEQLSAQWAAECLQSLKVAQSIIDEVQQLILVTDHQTIPKTIDEKIIVDIDLAILGATPQRYAEYEQQIRKEYSWVPYFLYKKKRKDVLKSFIKRPTIYQTAKLFNLLEQQARDNLNRII